MLNTYRMPYRARRGHALECAQEQTSRPGEYLNHARFRSDAAATRFAQKPDGENSGHGKEVR